MKTGLFTFCLIGITSQSYASQVAQCLGTLVLDNSPVIAKIYDQPNSGEIVIETALDTVKSPATVLVKTDTEISVSHNAFQISFSLLNNTPASSVQAFRDGAFFVEDFYCIRVN